MRDEASKTLPDLLLEEALSDLDLLKRNLATMSSRSGRTLTEIINTPVDAEGRTLLFIAARDNHPETVAYWLEAGADPNQAKKSGATPLLVAAENGYLPVVDCLLKAGANPNQARTDDGATPLYMTAIREHLACVGRLLKTGAGINKPLPNLPEGFDYTDCILIGSKMRDGTPVTNSTHPGAITTVEAYHAHVCGMKEEPVPYLLTHAIQLLKLYGKRDADKQKELLLHLQRRFQSIPVENPKFPLEELRRLNRHINRMSQEPSRKEDHRELQLCITPLIRVLRARSLCLAIFINLTLRGENIPFAVEGEEPSESKVPGDVLGKLGGMETALEANLTFWNNNKKDVGGSLWSRLRGLTV